MVSKLPETRKRKREREGKSLFSVYVIYILISQFFKLDWRNRFACVKLAKYRRNASTAAVILNDAHVEQFSYAISTLTKSL